MINIIYNIDLQRKNKKDTNCDKELRITNGISRRLTQILQKNLIILKLKTVPTIITRNNFLHE